MFFRPLFDPTPRNRPQRHTPSPMSAKIYQKPPKDISKLFAIISVGRKWLKTAQKRSKRGFWWKNSGSLNPEIGPGAPPLARCRPKFAKSCLKTFQNYLYVYVSGENGLKLPKKGKNGILVEKVGISPPRNRRSERNTTFLS